MTTPPHVPMQQPDPELLEDLQLSGDQEGDNTRLMPEGEFASDERLAELRERWASRH